MTDLRFKNEFNKVKEFNGITIRINRDNCVKMNHISETDLDDMEFDYEIDNNSSINDLIKQVRNILIQEKIINE